MRILIVIVILFICFISGVMYGTNNQSSAEVSPMAPAEHNIENNESALPSAEPVVTPTYKVASALESIVNFFYEIVVGILYQISKLFF